MVLGTSAEKVTGYISFPCCKKQKKILYGYPTGQVSDMCPRCKKKEMFDLDRRVSWNIEAVRSFDLVQNDDYDLEM